METPSELLIEQRNGAIEKFYLLCINDISGAEIPLGQRNYSVYKSNPFKGFSINILQKDEKHYLRLVENNGHEEYKKKNIVFAALCFIADNYQVPIYSSAVSHSYSFDDTDVLIDDTMGERWPKMLERYPERVEYFVKEGRYVLHPAQVRDSALNDK